MSKPLTIDELKALQVGDWVWVIDMYGKETESSYAQIIGTDDDGLTLPTNSMNWEYPDYGTKWQAWKNKEQAEKYKIQKANEENGLYSIYEYVDLWELVYTCVSKHEAEARLKELRGEK